jgi:hypothetical protein
MADLVFTEGSVITVAGIRPEEEALAIRDGLIVAVGDRMEVLAGPARPQPSSTSERVENVQEALRADGTGLDHWLPVSHFPDPVPQTKSTLTFSLTYRACSAGRWSFVIPVLGRSARRE